MSALALFAPFKAVGFVTDGNGFAVNRLGGETFVVTSIGKSFQVYRFDKLSVCLVSRPAPGKISCLQANGSETFVAVGSQIVVYNRTEVVREYSVHNEPISGLLLIGTHLISFDTANCIKVIDTKARHVVSQMKSLQTSEITKILHPATYINKVLFAYGNGHLELWNIHKQKIVYTFESHIKFFGSAARKRKASTMFNDEYNEGLDGTEADITLPPITALEQSPVCDVVAVGFQSGDILLMNLKLDKVLFTFQQAGGAVSSISFRTDAASERFPFMVTSSVDGRIHVWDLGSTKPGGEGEGTSSNTTAGGSSLERKLQCSIDEAHTAPVCNLHFLHGEPILISVSTDNSMKVWIFDSPDGSARLLRSREGHSGCPLRIRYYGGTTNVSVRDNVDANSCEVISVGSDGTVRLFNTALENQNRELSQKVILKKLGLRRRNERLPVAAGFDFCETRQRDWGNLVTIHKNHSNAYLWKFKHRTVTEVILRQACWSREDNLFSGDRSTHSTAVAMSICGNFCAIGSRGGPIYLYNVQSGQPRGSFPTGKVAAIKKGLVRQRQATPGNVLHEQKQFEDLGRGVGANSLNPIKVDQAAAASTGGVGVTEQGQGHLQEVTGLFIDSFNTRMVSCGLDGVLIFWDFSSYSIVNKVVLESPLTLMQGFRDGGFVAVAAQDRVVRVYDISTGKLTRRFSGHSREITDIAFTPDGRRLMTSSLDSTIRVWDMPTGRCLSWLSFESPVLSMTVSHSGEYLCLAQTGKEGIYMYVDRSLYETVHYWKEPTAPLSVADSLVLIDQNATTEAESTPAMETDVGETDGDAEDDNNGGIGSDGDEDRITLSQSQKEIAASREREDQRGDRAITLAAVPRAYWTALFHLEAIKTRNRAKAAPSAPVAAPFFLPTIVKGGVAPSFPTPAEYAQIIQQQGGGRDSKPENDRKVSAGSATMGAGGLVNAAPASVSGSTDKVGEEEERIVAELAAMGSAWEDDDEWGKDDNDDDKGLAAGEAAAGRDDVARKDTETVVDTSNSVSRIIKRKTSLPRCKLVAHILQEFPNGSIHGTGATMPLLDDVDGPVLTYLRSLPPPAVDVEFQALCLNEVDDEGIELLRCMLFWLRHKLVSGRNFEIVQAYLHRLLRTYGAFITSNSILGDDLEQVKLAHSDCAQKFRHLVQSNLCLLKMLAGLPPT